MALSKEEGAPASAIPSANPNPVSGPPPGLTKIINQGNATGNSSRSGTPGEGSGWENEMVSIWTKLKSGSWTQRAAVGVQIDVSRHSPTCWE